MVCGDCGEWSLRCVVSGHCGVWCVVTVVCGAWSDVMCGVQCGVTPTAVVCDV